MCPKEKEDAVVTPTQLQQLQNRNIGFICDWWWTRFIAWSEVNA